MHDWATNVFIRTLMRALRLVALAVDVPPVSTYVEYRMRRQLYTVTPRSDSTRFDAWIPYSIPGAGNQNRIRQTELGEQYRSIRQIQPR